MLDDDMLDSDEEVPQPPLSKRGRPRKSAPHSTATSDEDAPSADPVPEKKRQRRTRQSAPLSQEEADEVEVAEDEISQETDIVPETPSPANADDPGHRAPDKPLLTVVEDQEAEEMEDNGIMGDDDQDERWGLDHDDLDDPPVGGASGTTLIDDHVDDQDGQSVDADTSRGTIITDSQDPAGSDSLPLDQPSRVRRSTSVESPSLSVADDDPVASSSQVDDIESSQEEEPVVVAAAAVKSKPVRPLRQLSPPRFKPDVQRAAHLTTVETPMSSQVEEFESSSLEDEAARTKAAQATAVRTSLDNAEAGPSRGQLVQSHFVLDDDDDVVEVQRVGGPVGRVQGADDAVLALPKQPVHASAPAPAVKPKFPLSSIKPAFRWASEAAEEVQPFKSVETLSQEAVERAHKADDSNGRDRSPAPDGYPDDGFDNFNDYELPPGGEDEGDDVTDVRPADLLRERSMDVDEVVAREYRGFCSCNMRHRSVLTCLPSFSCRPCRVSSGRVCD